MSRLARQPGITAPLVNRARSHVDGRARGAGLIVREIEAQLAQVSAVQAQRAALQARRAEDRAAENGERAALAAERAEVDRLLAPLSDDELARHAEAVVAESPPIVARVLRGRDPRTFPAMRREIAKRIHQNGGGSS